jgi:hypothetical protein
MADAVKKVEPPVASKLADLTKKLEDAVNDATSKLNTLEASRAAMNKAQADYDVSRANAKDAKKNLMEALEAVIPTDSNRVR